MTKREFATLACKILGIYALLLALGSFSGVFQLLLGASNTLPAYPLNGATKMMALVSLIPTGMTFTAGLLLWGMSESLAQLMVREQSNDQSGPVTFVDGQALAFSVLGVWGLLQAIPNLGRLGLSYILVTQSSFSVPDISIYMSRTVLPDLFSVGLHFALSLWLLLGAKGIARWVNSLRNVGRDSLSDESKLSEANAEKVS